ncbi:MAG: amidohydrolase family protein [Sphingomonas sp.]
MRIVALEEHYSPAELAGRIPADVLRARGWSAGDGRPGLAALQGELREAGALRLASMDRAGISVQVMSMTGAGAELLAGADGVALARAYNDRLHQLALEHPDRFAGFCHLPMADPDAAADELERGVRELGLRGALVNGTTGGRFLDDRAFEPLLARAATLDVPIYLHPSLPPNPVLDAYYGDLPGHSGFLLAGPGFGWHAETAIHLLRLVLAGAFERHPGLKLIIGHMGEGLATMMDRLDEVFGAHARQNLSAGVGDTIRARVWVTTSGFFSMPPFQAALSAFGVERLLFSVDYPFSSNDRAVAFLRGLPLPPPTWRGSRTRMRTGCSAWTARAAVRGEFQSIAGTEVRWRDK